MSPKRSWGGFLGAMALVSTEVLLLAFSLMASANAGTPELAATTHWAFQPVTRPAVPEVKDPQFASKNPIDAFVAAKLAERGLQMSPATDPRSFIRRVTLDLIGLPPTPEEVDAFVRECASVGDTASRLPAIVVARLVDR